MYLFTMQLKMSAFLLVYSLSARYLGCVPPRSHLTSWQILSEEKLWTSEGIKDSSLGKCAFTLSDICFKKRGFKDKKNNSLLKYINIPCN